MLSQEVITIKIKKPERDSKSESESKTTENKETEHQVEEKKYNNKSLLNALGPGIVSGAADTDPSSIATYSQAGAKFGYGQLWLAIVTFPIVSIIQEMCARIGLVTGTGLAGIIKQNYSRKLLFSVVTLLVITNTINIGADIGAMGASLRLLIPQIPFVISTIIFAVIILVAEIFIPYKTYSKFLKYLALSVILYIITGLLAVNGPSEWIKIGISTIIPHFESTKDFTSMVIAILGTTISPYLMFWQTSEEVEEEINKGQIKEMGENQNEKEKGKTTKKQVRFMRADIFSGMVLAQSIFWFIMVTSAAALHNNNITNISTAEQAAKALEPLVKGFPYAGQISGGMFAAGIIGNGLISIPVLAASASYAVSEAFEWKEGLYKKFLQAPKFYGVIIVATIIGLWINFSGIDPIQALIFTAIINGFVSVPLLVVVTKIANNKEILGDNTNNRISNVISISAIIIIGVAAILMMAYSWIIK